MCSIFIEGESVLDGEMLFKQKAFAQYSTKYGDGQYFDQDRNAYPVDSGSIGCIPIELCELDRENIITNNYGRIVKFSRYFETGKERSGVIFFEEIAIDTND